MTGADALVTALADSGVSACFANPGTSEMHLVSALDREARIRSVLCLFEGVATGAADGFGRITGRPACTLLHLGPGYANGASNLHNARRARTPIVNIIGDHATYHRRLDAPLTSDIEALAAPNSVWIKTASSSEDVAELAVQAVAASLGPPAGSASLILPADCAWSSAERRASIATAQTAAAPDSKTIEEAALLIGRAQTAVILLGGHACTERALRSAARLAAQGLRIVTDTFLPRQARGAGRFAPARLKYFAEMAADDLKDVDLLVTVETSAPVAFFAYPGKPSMLLPANCKTFTLASPQQNGAAALEMLADELRAPASGRSAEYAPAPVREDALTPKAIGESLARHMPEHTIVSEDASTSGPAIFAATVNARPHDWLMLTGGSIGQALPAALGAAIAAPERKVVAVTGDGAALYTVQALWTMAREKTDVTTVVCANHSYRILDMEFTRTGAGDPGASARRLLDLSAPRIDWVALAAGMGVPARRCSTAAEFDRACREAMNEKGPMLIEANLGG